MRKYFKWVFLLLPTIIYTIFAINKYSRKTRSKSRLIRYKKMRGIIQKGLKVFKVKFYVTGQENIPNEMSYVFTPNHQSMIDPLLIMNLLDDPTSFISKSNLEHVPFAGKGIRSIEGIFLNRTDLRQEIKSMKIMEKSLMNDNLKWCIFPEGKRTKNEDYVMNEFKAGSFKYPQKLNKKIIPVAIFGSFRILPKENHDKCYPVQICFMKPITPVIYENMTTQELSQYTHDLVEKKVDELRIKDVELQKSIK